MTLTTRPHPRTQFRNTRQHAFRWRVTNTLGLTSTPTSFIDMTALRNTDYVAVIDEIVIHNVSAAAANNQTVIIAANGVSLRINFPGSGTHTSYATYRWPVRGNLVIPFGQVLTATASVDNVSGMTIRWRKMHVTEYKATYGAVPTVATHGTVTTTTPEEVVAGVDGKSIEILAFTMTGHGFSASAGAFALQFTDGGSNHHTIFAGQYLGAEAAHATNALVGNCIIRGPTGYGLRVLGDAQTDGNNVNANVIYRLVDDHETWQPTGVPGTQDAGGEGKHFWFHSGATGGGTTDLFDDTIITKPMIAHFDGLAFSMQATGANGVTIGTAEAFVDVLRSIANGSTALVRQDLDFEVPLNAFDIKFFRAGITITGNSQLVWGRLLPSGGADGSQLQSAS